MVTSTSRFPCVFRVSLFFRFFRWSYFSSRGVATNRVVLSMKQSIGNVFPKYLTRVCRIDSYREGSSSIFLVFSLFKKKEGCPWWFRWVISVTVAIPTSGVGLRMKAINRQRFPQIPHKNLQDRLLLRRVFFHFPCVFFLKKNEGRPWLFRWSYFCHGCNPNKRSGLKDERYQ